MSPTAMIVSIVSIVACLVLATRGAPFRGIGTARTVRYALVWAAIIIGLVLFLQVSGLRLGE